MFKKMSTSDTIARGDLWEDFLARALTFTWKHSSLLACFLHFLSLSPPSSPLSIFYSLCLLSSPLSAWHPFHHGGQTAEDGILEAAAKASAATTSARPHRARGDSLNLRRRSPSAGRMTEWNEVVSKWVTAWWGIKKIRMETEEDEPLI